MSTTDTVSPPPETAPLLELKAQINPNGEASATLPIRWCVTPELVAMLEESGFEKPYLVLVVRYPVVAHITPDHNEIQYVETQRHIVPLLKEFDYVSFKRPGENEVLALVVNLARHEDASAVHGARSIFFWKTDEPSAIVSSQIKTNAKLKVNVPAEMFAKEPPNWLKHFVSNFFESKPVDECRFRQRVIVSFLFGLPLALTIGLVARLVVGAIALFFGLRKIKWSGFNPLNMKHFPWPAKYSTKTSVYFDTKDNHERPWPFWLLNPPVLVILPATVFAVGSIKRQHHSSPLLTLGVWRTVAWVDGSLLALVVAILVCIGIVLVFGTLLESMSSRLLQTPDRVKRQLDKAHDKQKRREREASERQKKAEERRQLLYQKLAAMSCERPNWAPKLEALPREKQTVTLRFQDLKMKVCKPFAR